MLDKRKLAKRQAAMKSRRGKRPWDDRKDEADRNSRVRFRKLLEMGMSDVKIASAFGIPAQAVWFLRNAHSLRTLSKPVRG
jgi:hypothetical protein